MDLKYSENVALFKAFADTNRLMIVDVLSCEELCACKILEKLGITQPTLSHHMKILCDCGVLNSRKNGKWIYYSLNKQIIDGFMSFLQNITNEDDGCICN